MREQETGNGEQGKSFMQGCWEIFSEIFESEVFESEIDDGDIFSDMGMKKETRTEAVDGE